jgi:hippurate hydrolase
VTKPGITTTTVLATCLTIGAQIQLAHGQTPATEVDGVFGNARAFYVDLHQHPELSSHEIETAAKLAARLKAAGYEVTEHVGGTGVVAILRNGNGPVAMLRTELDALPVEEKTGLPYASTVRVRDDQGRDVAVAHACGHDLHMASLLATATILAQTRNTWHGTLMLIGQPAEETITGAKAMLDDGLFTRFPKPDFIVAPHVVNDLPSGTVGIGAGIRYASADSLRITITGRGGHGARPETTIDPVVIAARTVVALQTIVSREVAPGEMAIVTVGYVHAGTKNNIIPDNAEIGLSVRAFKPAVRKQLLDAITRVVNAEAAAGGATEKPRIEHYEGTAPVVNDQALAARLQPVLTSALGADHVKTTGPATVSEDFSYFTDAGVPSFAYVLGGAEPSAYQRAQSSGQALPSNHSPLFAPDLDPALRTGIQSEVVILRQLLGGSPQ